MTSGSTIEQKHLPVIASAWEGFAMSLGGRTFRGRVPVSSLRKDEKSGAIYWVRSNGNVKSLTRIDLFKEMLKFPELSGSTHHFTRENVALFGRLGALGLRQIVTTANKRQETISGRSMLGLSIILAAHQKKLSDTFQPIARTERPREQEALLYLSQAALILGLKEAA